MKHKWYLSTWFICLMFLMAIAVAGTPSMLMYLVIGVLLVITRVKKKSSRTDKISGIPQKSFKEKGNPKNVLAEYSVNKQNHSVARQTAKNTASQASISQSPKGNEKEAFSKTSVNHGKSTSLLRTEKIDTIHNQNTEEHKKESFFKSSSKQSKINENEVSSDPAVNQVKGTLTPNDKEIDIRKNISDDNNKLIDDETIKSIARESFIVSIKSGRNNDSNEEVDSTFVKRISDMFSDNNSFGRFCNYQFYWVKGKNAESKTLSKRFSATSEESAINQAIEAGIVDPSEVRNEELNRPSERQLKFLQDLKIEIPDGCTNDDVSTILTRVLDFKDDKDPSPEFINYAQELNVCFSYFTGEHELLGCICSQVSEKDMAILYAYAIKLSRTSNATFKDPRSDPDFSAFECFAEKVKEKSDIRKSLYERTLYDYLNPNGRSKANRAVIECLANQKA